MKVISLIQPWASLIAIGAKKLETRSWPAPSSLIGQRIGIAASKGFPRDARDLCHEDVFCATLWPDIYEAKQRWYRQSRSLHDYFSPDNETQVNEIRSGLRTQTQELDRRIKALPLGCIIATARLTGSWSTNNDDLLDRLTDDERCFGNFAPDRYMWGLSDVYVLPEPIPAKGALGFWEYPIKEEVPA